MNDFIVLKYGGSSITKNGVDMMKKRINDELSLSSSKTNIVIVLSAFGNITDYLHSYTLAKNQEYLHDVQIKLEILANNLKVNKNVYQKKANDFFDMMMNKKTLSKYDKINLISYGEYLSKLLIYTHLSEWLSVCDNIKLHDIDSTDILECVPNSDNDYNDNNSDKDHSQKGKYICHKERILEVCNNDKMNIIITQGYVVKYKNYKCLLSRGGSDTSGSLISNGLNVKYFEIWSDVNGIYTCDPNKITKAKLISNISYNLCQELSAMGAQIIHPFCIKPCQEKNIPIFIRNTFNNDNSCMTKISNDNSNNISITCRKNISLFEIKSLCMWNGYGFASDILSAFAKHEINIDIVTTSQFSVSITTSDDLSHNIVDDIKNMLKYYDVKYTKMCDSISIVSNDVRKNININDCVKCVSKSYEIFMTHVSDNNMSLTFVMDKLKNYDVLNDLHELLICSDSDVVSNGVISCDKWWCKKTEQLISTYYESFCGDSPCYAYIYDKTTVINQINTLKNSLSRIDNIYYAMKANNNVEILSTIIDNGLGIECVSIEEYNHIKIKYPKDVKMIFTPNFCSISDYTDPVRDENTIVIVDNVEALYKNPRIFASYEIGLRIDFGHGDGHHQKVITEGDNSKFGIPIKDINDELFKYCKKHNIKIVGLHSHKGSGITDYKKWLNTLNNLIILYKKYLDGFNNLQWFNLGGGFGIGGVIDLHELNKGLINCMDNDLLRNIKLIIEPGRFLVADAGVLISEVKQIKSKNNNVNYLGIGAGMNVLIRPMLYGAYHDIYNLCKIRLDGLDEYNNSKKYNYCVVGPICESGDCFGNHYLPETKINDLVLIDQAGAYGEVMSSNYNMKEDAPEYTLLC